MAGKRTRYSPEFKAKVALEALRGELTAAQLAAKHGIHQTRPRCHRNHALHASLIGLKCSSIPMRWRGRTGAQKC